jgi:hypothetical protein
MDAVMSSFIPAIKTALSLGSPPALPPSRAELDAATAATISKLEAKPQFSASA